MTDAAKKFTDFVSLVATLRSEQGCPWDRKQTPESLKRYLLEETHELLEDLDTGEPAAICGELGDLIYIIILYCQIFSERGVFSIAEALDTITAKMIRRHPHVFGNDQATTETELQQSWDRIKTEERSNTQAGRFASIPRSLPALARAQQVSRRAARTGFEWPNPGAVESKLQEELLEFQNAAAMGDKASMQEELGDLLFAAVNLGRLHDINCEEALQSATKKFIDRFEKMEHGLAQENLELGSLGFDEMLSRWQKSRK